MAIKFQTNIPQTLYFPYGDFMEVSGQYGVQFLYTVESEGQRDRLYATPKLHEDMQQAGIVAGDLVTITKVEAEGNHMAWQIDREGVQQQPAPDQPPARSATPAGGQQQQSQPRETKPAPRAGTPTLAQMDALFKWAVATAADAYAETQHTSEDLRTSANTLFLECSRKGIFPTDGAQNADIPANPQRRQVEEHFNGEAVPAGTDERNPPPPNDDDLPF